MAEGQFEHPLIDRMVGFTYEGAKKAIINMIEHHGDSTKEMEVEKTEDEVKTIQFCRVALHDMLKEFIPEERTKAMQLDDERIHLLPEGGTSKLTEGVFHSGTYTPLLHAVIIDRSSNRAIFADRLFHEMSHAYSYRAIQQTAKPGIENYRLGLELWSRDGQTKYFVDLNEGVAQFLSRRFHENVLKRDPAFREELQRASEQEHEFGPEGVWKNFIKVMDEILAKNKEQFQSREEAIKIFVRAAYDGNILPPSRLIESTYGRGSLRTIASTGHYHGRDEELFEGKDSD